MHPLINTIGQDYQLAPRRVALDSIYHDRAAVPLVTCTLQDGGSSPALGTHVASEGQCASSSIRNSSSQASVLSYGTEHTGLLRATGCDSPQSKPASVHVHGSTTHHSQKAETTQVAVDGCMQKTWSRHTTEYRPGFRM